MQKQLPNVLRGLFILALFLTASVSWGQTTIVNYNFNSGSSYAALTSTNATNVTSTVSSTEAFTTYGGVASGNQAFVQNTTAGQALAMANSSGTNTKFFQFQLGGTALANYSKYKIYYQAQRSAAGAQTITIAYSTNGTTYTNFPTTGSPGNGSFSQVLADLSSIAALDNASAVYIRLVVSGASGTGTLRVDNFQINAQGLTAPAVSTTAITDVANINTNSATVPGGNVTASGGATVSARGIVWGTATEPTLSNNVLAASEGGTGTFTVADLTSLNSNTRYYYRAYATNSVGTSYGTEYSFFTKAITPGAPLVDNQNTTTTSLTVAINTNGNNADVTYSIRVNGNSFVQENGTVNTTEVFQKAADWGTKIVTGLTAGSEYSIDVRAKTSTSPQIDGYDTNTAYSTATVTNTLPATAPTLTIGTTPAAFGNVCTNATVTRNFSFTPTNLTNGATVLVDALAGFSYSASETGTYTPTLILSNLTNGSPATVWVKFTPTAVQSYDGNIQADGQGDNVTARLTVNVTGSGINTAGIVTADAANAITSTSATLQGTATAGCTAFSAYGFEYTTIAGFTSNITQVAASNLSGINFSVNLNNLSPATIYFYRAYATDSAGTHYGTQQSFTTASLTAPVATSATAITQTGFVANWNAVTGAESYRLDVSENENFGIGNYAQELFFSEYVEGATPGNNRALEIYNGTGAAIDLSAYSIKRGDTSGTTVTLAGILADGATYVIANSGAAANTLAVANRTVSFSESNVLSFTGANGQSVQLLKNGTVIDIVSALADRTLVRKSDVLAPSTSYIASQWTTFPVDNIANLGNHSFDGGFEESVVQGYDNLLVNNLSQVITGLNPYTNYYYRVRAFSTNSTSTNSNIIAVTTKPGTVTWTSSGWVPNVTPDATIAVVIDAVYSTGANGTFNAKNITLNQGNTFTVNTGNTLTVEENIINNADAEDFVVENNAAIIQNSATANTTAITVIKNSNPLYRLDYTLWSSPVSGETLSGFSSQTSAGRFYLYGFNTTDNREQYNTVAPSTVFAPARGYLIRMPNGNLAVPGYNGGTASYSFEGTFTGAPHNGNYSVTPAVNENYTAVGNPYPSPISVVDFFTQNSGSINQTSGLYFWRKRNDSDASSYATLTLAAYTSNAGYNANSGTTDEENPYEYGGQDQQQYFAGNESTFTIAQGQGFFVQNAETPTADITFTNSMRRVSVGNQSFFRTGTGSETRSRLWLNLTDAQHNRSQTAVAYMDNATTGIDYGYDGTILNDGNRIALYSIAANSTLAIQARPAFSTTDVVTMGFVAPAAGQFSISLDRTDGLFAQGQDIYLKDNLLGTITGLNDTYTFTTEAGTFNNRFEVVYATSALGTDETQLNANSVVVYKVGSTIHINTGNAEMINVNIYDINGRKLYSKNATTVTTTISNLQAAQQVLIVEVNTIKGKVSKRIVY